jgi:DNA-binding response OmpR family regulator
VVLVAPDMLVIDLDLPAHGASHIIRAARAMSDVSVIGLKPHGDGQVSNPGDALGVTKYLAKPIDPGEFLSTARSVTQATI